MIFQKGKKHASLRKGYKHRLESRNKMSIVRIGNKNAVGPHKMSEEVKNNIRKGHVRGKDHPMFGKKLSELQKSKIGARIAYERIEKEIGKFEKEGYRVFPITRVVPDLIIVRWNWDTNRLEVKAVEVEYGKPNYAKYKKGSYEKRFDEVIWLIKGGSHAI